MYLFHEGFFYLLKIMVIFNDPIPVDNPAGEAMISALLYGIQVDVFHFPLKGWWLVAGLTYAMYQLTPQWLAGAQHGLADQGQTP